MEIEEALALLGSAVEIIVWISLATWLIYSGIRVWRLIRASL